MLTSVLLFWHTNVRLSMSLQQLHFVSFSYLRHKRHSW